MLKYASKSRHQIEVSNISFLTISANTSNTTTQQIMNSKSKHILQCGLIISNLGSLSIFAKAAK